MTAGPYPTKAMFQALQARVPEIRQNAGFVPSPRQQISGVDVASLHFERRAMLISGFVLPGAWQAADFAEVDIRDLNNDAYVLDVPYHSGGSAADLVVAPPKDGVTEVRFPRPVRVTTGQLRIAFSTPKILYAGDTQVAGLPPLTGHLMQGETRLELAPEIVLLELERPPLPVVPVPSRGHPVGRQWHLEVVVPAGAGAYLHVFFADSETSVAAEYHVPLTTGLPQ